MRQIPISSILPYGDFPLLPALSGPSLEWISAHTGTGSSMQNVTRHDMFHATEDSMPSVTSGGSASGSIHDLILRELENLPKPLSVPRHHGAVPNHIMTQSSQRQIGSLERNFSNHIYHQQPECNIHNLHLPPPPHRSLLEQRSNFNYQQRQQNIGYQPSSPLLTAASIPGLQTSQHDAGAAQQMINQRIGLQPNQLSNINAFQESFQKTNYASSSYAQPFKYEPSRTIDPQQLQFHGNKAIQESQSSTNPGTRDSSIMASEDRTEWLDSVYQKIQKCKEECLPDVLMIYRNYVSQLPQKVPEIVSKMMFQIEDMIKLLNLQRSGMEHKVGQNVHIQIDKIYAFTRQMRKKRPMLFAGPSEESKSDYGEQQTVPPAISDSNLTPQKHGLLQQGSAAGSEAENNVVSPLQPAKTSTDTQPIDPSVTVNQSKNLHLEAVNQSSPIDRLIKAVKEASPETLISAAHDILAVTSAAERIYEIPAYGDERTYRCADLANYNLHTKEMPYQRIKRNFNAVVNNFYDIDGLIDSGSHMLNSSQSSTEKAKRQKVEENKSLMTEIEFLNGKLLETRVDIEKPDAGFHTPECGGEVMVSCTFRAAHSMALNTLSHLFPVRMQLRIPREYPHSHPTILSCRHESCGEMCAWLQVKYESWSRTCDMKSVQEIVQGWNACARELYSDICKKGIYCCLEYSQPQTIFGSNK